MRWLLFFGGAVAVFAQPASDPERDLKQVEAQLAALRDLAEPEIGGRYEELTRGYRPPVGARVTEELFVPPVEARFVRLKASGEVSEVRVDAVLSRGAGVVDLGRATRVDKVRWRYDPARVPIRYVLEVSADGKKWKRVADSDDRVPYDLQEREEFLLVRAQPSAAPLLARRAALRKQLAERAARR